MKNAIVVGGTRGIGSGVVNILHKKGWSVTSTGVSEEEVVSYRNSNTLSHVIATVLDVTDQQSVEKVFGNESRIDGLVNCAGIILRNKEYNIETFQQVIDVNLTGTMRTSLAAYEKLRESNGAIVNTASMLSFFGGALVPAYSASKGGVVQLTKALAARWAEDGIRVNAVAPGWIETEMTEEIRNDSIRNDFILKRTPMNRWGKPEEVGEVVAWLLSETAGFITGSVYRIDGGYAST